MKYYYVVGNKASKSLSPIIFNHWFKKYKIKAKYKYLQLNNNNFDKKILEKLKDKKTGGLNITIPFKQKIIKHLDILDSHSKKINAVNCVSKTNKIKGSNTDWEGYYRSLPKFKNPKKTKVVLIGYGGASLAIHYVLKKNGFRNIYILNRSKKRINFEKNIKYTLSLSKLKKHLPDADLIINTTPLNPIKHNDIKLVRKKTIISDIVYYPKETKFLKTFPKNKKVYGISMLLYQAVSCFNLWFSFKPSINKNLIKILDKKLT